MNGAHLEHKAVEMIPCLYDVLYGDYHQEPRLTIIHDLIPHRSFVFDEDGNFGTESENPLDYYGQHIYSCKVLIGMIDMILLTDPNAVIILQSDHGLHGNTDEDFLEAFGETADTIELWNSTLSAVRIPPKYQTGEEEHMMDTPLNISRYLMNNFVGEDYEYLDGQ